MTALNELEPVTLDFFDTAPLRVQCTMVAKCTPEVLFESVRTDLINDLVRIPVAGHFVPAAMNLPDQRGILLGDPPEDKEGGTGAVCVKEVENFVGAAYNPGRVVIPLLPRNLIPEGVDVKVVLHVDRECVDDR